MSKQTECRLFVSIKVSSLFGSVDASLYLIYARGQAAGEDARSYEMATGKRWKDSSGPQRPMEFAGRPEKRMESTYWRRGRGGIEKGK